MFKDPHYAARENIVKVCTEKFGEISMQGIVPKMSETPGEVKWAGPDMGTHNEEIYMGALELSERDFRQLKAEGVI
jgi:crotonobetainyl-CoA:carnitine CoA-transferase CaiB-like acyl-CoA transferase